MKTLRSILILGSIYMLTACKSISQLELLNDGLPVKGKNEHFVPIEFSVHFRLGYSRKNNNYMFEQLVNPILKLPPKNQETFLKGLYRLKSEIADLKKKEFFSFDCLAYLPGQKDFFPDTSIFSYLTLSYTGVRESKPRFSGEKKFIKRYPKIKSSHFDFSFVFPLDHTYYPYAKEDEKEVTKSNGESLYAVVENTTLALPQNIPLKHFNYSDILESELNRLRLTPSSGFSADSTYIGLSRDTLQLNPAFVSAYDESIEYIWQLYLFEISYNILGDTLICYEGGGIETFRGRGKNWGRVIFWLRKFDELEIAYARCEPVLYTSTTEKYLESAFIQDPKLFTSFYELILWQIFQPTDFEISDSKGRRRAFTFTSRDYRHEGRYEVKFDLMRPFNYKVSKL